MQPNIALYQISDIQAELEGMLHGTTLNQVTNLFGCFDRAARRVLEDIDPQETKMVSVFGQIFDGVFDYPLDVSVKGNKIVDIFPQANRNLRDNFSQVYNKSFDLWKNYTLVPDFTPRYSGAFRSIRINAANLQTGIQINAADAYNGNGIWTAVQNVSNVETNNQLMIDGASGSVQFDIDQTGIAASVAIIENSTMAAVDLSEQFNNATEFFSFYIPNTSGITSIRYLFGSDSSNYYDSGAITTGVLNAAFADGWNTTSTIWSSFNTVGSPDSSNITYIQIQITYDGTLQTQVLLNQFWSRLGRIFNIEFYSKYLFRDSVTGVFQERVTDETNYINLDTDAINLFIFASQGEIAQQMQGADALYFDANQSETRYESALAKYKNKYKSEIIKPKAYYYKIPRAGYRRFFGGNNFRS